jgi:hypothetical protein
MESEWVPEMIDILDFLYGPCDAAGVDSYVLCEINVSSCFAIPDQAPAAIARLALAAAGAPRNDRNRQQSGRAKTIIGGSTRARLKT